MKASTTRKRQLAYRTRRALRSIRSAQPKTVEETRALGITLIHEGTGAFRAAYRIHGTRLLIKFPRTEDGERVINSNHTRMEVKKIRALLKFPMWQKHLPPVYYFNSRDGVMVTKFYPVGKRGMAAKSAKSLLIGELVKVFCGVVLGDITPDNVRAERGNLMLIDLGY
jgi:uncharacterized membrane protein